jgi:predicted ester cyclase
MAIPGFSADFTDIPDYIIKITEQIWEGRGIGRIRDWYAADCLVHSSMGPSRGAEATIAGTLETLRLLPDRRLLAEDIIWSEDAPGSYLSSHRLIAPGHHRGGGALGPPTGRAVAVRAIAECECRGNQVVEEWLVRDAAGLGRQIGGDPASVATGIAARDAAAGIAPWQIGPAATLRAEGRFRPPVLHRHPAAELARETLSAMWRGDLQVVADRYHPACSLHAPGAITHYGHEGVWGVMIDYLAAFPDARLVVEHSIAREDPGQPTRVATRWWMVGTHSGHGRFGTPSGAVVLILGIHHAHCVGGRIREEWMLVDDLAVEVQIARHRG